MNCQTLEVTKTARLPAIHGFLPCSLNEWAGKMAAIVFLSGCNLRCPFCHGWRFVKPGETPKEIDFNIILQSLKANEGWVDGVVISGGEPTINPELENLVNCFLTLGVEVKLHSNATKTEQLAPLLKKGKLECIALDFKAPFKAEKLKAAMGVEVKVESLRATFALVGSSSITQEYHTTLCPAFLNYEDLREMAKTLAKLAPNGQWILQQYSPNDVLDIAKAGKISFADTQLQKWLADLKKIYANTILTGI